MGKSDTVVTVTQMGGFDAVEGTEGTATPASVQTSEGSMVEKALAEKACYTSKDGVYTSYLSGPLL